MVIKSVRSLAGLTGRVSALLMIKRFTWIEEDRLGACSYPRRERALRDLARRRIGLVVNLHERPHPPERLARHGLVELHLPVRDFTPPTPDQLRRGVAALKQALADGTRVAVHCGAGLGRTGTLLACFLVEGGREPDEAIGLVRAARPGSLETSAQEKAVHDFWMELKAAQGARPAQTGL